MKLRSIIIGSLVAFFVNQSMAQNAFGDYNVVTTAVPFLMISPDARAGGMGDVGAASSSDANNIHWNAGKMAFLGKDQSYLSLSYTPWLNRLVPDINLAYLTYQKAINDKSAFGMSLKYFSLGDINFTDNDGNSQGTFNPNEFAIDGAYSLKLSERWGAGIALRYIYSNLTQGQSVPGLQTKPGQAFGADIGFYYKSRRQNLKNGQKGYWSFGTAITNMGSKISYSESGQENFIPTNLRIGGRYDLEIDEYNRVGFMLDINKLLVPTPPEYYKTDNGRDSTDADGNKVIKAGKDDNVSPIQGMVQALDPNAKPNGMSELIDEIVWNVGIEYWYSDIFAVRGGYQHEHESKGNRKYFTLGIGLKYNVFGLDFSYLIPANQSVRSPLENTLRFTLYFDFGALATGEE
ncbi:MAG: type IX secretion system outer membrane channel protein PorV [Schleiferiaceae bacterium]|jgi:hypothetical protein|nr:type IX secretion system outer membrane channel protein PorV [Schleiferiaceae bacterium]